MYNKPQSPEFNPKIFCVLVVKRSILEKDEKKNGYPRYHKRHINVIKFK